MGPHVGGPVGGIPWIRPTPLRFAAPADGETSIAELMARIQRAREWTQLEAQKNYSLVEERIDDGVLLQALAQQSRAAAFEAVRVVLEEILAPGTHSDGLPAS